MIKKSLPKLNISFVIFMLAFSNMLHAQEVPRWEDYTPALIANNVNDVVVNSQGNMWLLSNEKFFELKQREQFFRIEATVDINPNHIEIDNSDQIWLVSQNNFQFDGNHLAYSIYKNGVLTTFLREDITGFPNDNSSNDDDITSFLIDTAGNSWFGFDNGDVGKIDAQNSQYTHYANTIITDQAVRDLAVNSSNGDLYVAIQYHVYKLSSGSWSQITSSWTNNFFIEAVEVTSSGTVYFGGYNGIHEYNQGAITTYDMNNTSSPINIIDDIKIVDDMIIFSGNDLDGVDYIVNSSFESIYTGIAESTNLYNFQSTLVVESMNPISLWLGTDEDGLGNIKDNGTFYFNNQTISVPITSNDFLYNTSFAGDKKYVVGTYGLTIKTDSLFEGLNPLYSNPLVGLPGNGGAYHMAYDSSEFLYLATLDGLAKLSVLDNSVPKIYDASDPQVNSDRFFKVFNLKKGQVLAVTADQYFIINQSGISSSKVLATAGLPSGSLWNAVVPEFTGTSVVGFWLAAGSGFYFYDFTTLTNFNSDVYHTNVTALIQGSNGTLWLGFDYYGEVLQTFDKVDQWDEINLPDIAPSSPDEQDIVDLEFDYNGTLWVLAQFKTSGNAKVTKLIEYKNNVFTIIDKQFQISDYSNDLAISPTGEKLIVSRKGLFTYIDGSYSNVDPCLPVSCPEGTQCLNGSCDPTDDACNGVVCPEGQQCFEGSCYDVCPDDGECDPESICINNLCVPLENACNGVVCPVGQQCFGGSCYDVCPDDGECDPESICINNLCVPLEDACNGVVCPVGQQCFGGSCYDVCPDDGECDPESICINNLCVPLENACNGVVCPVGQQCFDGSCYDVCPDDGECDPESICINNLCVPLEDACNGVVCPVGQQCFGGSCYDVCPDDGECDPESICINNLCVPLENACNGVVCPVGQQCFDGSCYDVCPDDGECDPESICINNLCVPLENACNGVVCPVGQQCFGGSCYDVCPDDGECDPESICINNLCVPLENACNGVVCPEGQQCFEGSCYDVCPDDGECDPESICINNLCVPLEDACNGVVCPVGQQCFEGSCYDVCPDDGECDPESICINNLCVPLEDACNGVVCPVGQQCFGGSCYDVCPDDGECDPESICINNLCVPLENACNGVVCPEGQQCFEGSCYDVCPDDGECDPESICINNLCVPSSEACNYLNCTEGNLCVFGKCYPFNPFNDNQLNLSGNLLGETFVGGRLAENEPVSGATIYLFNQAQTEINQFATTDAEGKFNFEKLRPGTYKVFVDYPTYKVKGDGLIILKPNVKNTNLDIVLVDEEYVLQLAYITGIAEDFANRKIFAVYPNPSRGRIILSSREAVGKVSIRVSDVTGKLLQQINMILPKSEEIFITDLQGESEGLKIIEIYQKGQLIHRSAIILSFK